MSSDCPHCPTNEMNGETDLCPCTEDRKTSLYCLCSLCGCGSYSVAELLFDVLDWCCENSIDKERTREPFGKKGTYCSSAHELAAKVLDKANLIEHGSGIGWPWATDKGREVRDWIKGEP